MTVAADVETVYALMCSTNYQQRKADAVGAQSCRVDINHEGDRCIVTVTRSTPNGDVPELIKSMVSATLQVTEVEKWEARSEDNSRSGSFDIDITGAPVSLHGQVTLAPCPEGSELTFSGDLKTSIPLFKNAIEKAASFQIFSTIDSEFALLTTQLTPPTQHDFNERSTS